MEPGRIQTETEQERTPGLGDSKIFYYEKCSHTVGRAPVQYQRQTLSMASRQQDTALSTCLHEWHLTGKFSVKVTQLKLFLILSVFN